MRGKRKKSKQKQKQKQTQKTTTVALSEDAEAAVLRSTAYTTEAADIHSITKVSLAQFSKACASEWKDKSLDCDLLAVPVAITAEGCVNYLTERIFCAENITTASHGDHGASYYGKRPATLDAWIQLTQSHDSNSPITYISGGSEDRAVQVAVRLLQLLNEARYPIGSRLAQPKDLQTLTCYLQKSPKATKSNFHVAKGFSLTAVLVPTLPFLTNLCQAVEEINDTPGTRPQDRCYIMLLLIGRKTPLTGNLVQKR